MKDGPRITGIAALIGDRARAEILATLLGGQALTATELARAADVTRQTVSSHLAKLVEGRLLAVESQGRHRYRRAAVRAGLGAARAGNAGRPVQCGGRARLSRAAGEVRAFGGAARSTNRAVGPRGGCAARLSRSGRNSGADWRYRTCPGGLMNTVHESPPVLAPPPRNATPERELDEYFQAALEAMHAAPDWERLIEEGAMPALALGAERRLRR